MPIKKIEIHGLNPEHPLAVVIDEINANLDNILEHVNGIDAETGVVGPTGAKGDKGDPGQQGIEGPAGKDGKDGRDGIDGKDGKDGSPGLNGRDGKDGAAGQQGPAGQDGKNGQDGQPGRDGLPGRDGVDGKDGKDGLPGIQGPKGDKGEPGIQGLPGKDGADGLPGTAGKDGLPGATGAQGVAGPAGAQGPIGPKGDTGTTGAQGPAGVGIKGFASGYVNAGSFVTLDNLKFSVTTSGNRGLSCATVSGTVTLSIAATYSCTAGGNGHSTPWPGGTYTTTPSGSWFGYHFPNAGDGSTYLINDYTNQRMYRVHLLIGYGYNNNFISIERLG
jgi:hypothetical protein